MNNARIADTGGAEKNDRGALRILIVDDHTVVREGLKRILIRGFPDAEFHFAHHAKLALELLRQKEWDIMLLDVDLPGGPDGLDVLTQMKDIRPETKALVLTGHAMEKYAIRVMKLGARGYLAKDGSDEEILTAVKTVLAGGRYVTAELAESLVTRLTGESGGKPHQLLSNREHQILLALAGGKSVKEISFELALSANTVSTYRTRIFQKMHFKSTTDAVRYALKEGLVQ